MDVFYLRVVRKRLLYSDIVRVVDEIVGRGSKRVLVQAPDGLKWVIPYIVEKLKKSENVVVSSDPCYGACFVAYDEARLYEADLILHIGHSPLRDVDYGDSVVFVEVLEDPSLAKHFDEVGKVLRAFNRVGVVTNVHHVHLLEELSKLLRRSGKEPIVGGDGVRAWHRGQVIGCDYSSAKEIEADVEAFLFVGGGTFHPLGLSLATAKPVFAFDPYSGRAYDLEPFKKKVLVQRFQQIERTKRCRRFGVLAGARIGQHRPALIHRVCDYLRKHAKSFDVLVVEQVAPERLYPFKAEAFVDTACPRVAIDDAAVFKKPVLLPKELLVAMGDKSWEDLVEEGLLSQTFGYDLHIL